VHYLKVEERLRIMFPGLLRNVEISRTGKVSGFHLRFSWNVLFIVLTRFVFCWIDHLKGADQQEWLCEIFVSKISLAAKWTLSSLNCNQCSNMSFRKPEVKDMVNNSVPFYNPSLHSLYCLSILSTTDSLRVNCEAIHVARI
jgi:hypothetical protein